ncbi:hypothetical protein LEMA_P088470.1 [Plenodomus lingam JN3]|uniref:RING-type domain-containing protein n=1 Tax=Leptosphaeria maculans (strain JN3 / isolate v23.1.3 / race Av1-4-5-6-7-8) TaxID=985895 RepID=E5A7L3_LEPMJ|nr:hypothetical protein LEMA_P088470.1 [Plenodomus lingam JN3]CBX99608.1 hypothetical protein LEMA_P088470.1 [Plenodomus lingam JN3]
MSITTNSETFGSLPFDHFKGSEEPCPICYERTSGAIISTTCGHVFHLGCLNTWFDQQDECCRDCTCPYCRTTVFEASLFLEDITDYHVRERSNLELWWNVEPPQVTDTVVSEPSRSEAGREHEGMST